MGQAPLCQGCELQPSAILVQIIGTPDVLTFCAPCSGVWAEQHAQAIAESMGDEWPGIILQALAALRAAQEAEAAPTPPEGGKKPRTRKPRGKATDTEPGYDTGRVIGEIVEDTPRPDATEDRGEVTAHG